MKTFWIKLSFGKSFFGNGGFQDMFVYQPIFSTLDLKEGKGTEYSIVWKLREMIKAALEQLYKVLPLK